MAVGEGVGVVEAATAVEASTCGRAEAAAAAARSPVRRMLRIEGMVEMWMVFLGKKLPVYIVISSRKGICRYPAPLMSYTGRCRCGCVRGKLGMERSIGVAGGVYIYEARKLLYVVLRIRFRLVHARVGTSERMLWKEEALLDGGVGG